MKSSERPKEKLPVVYTSKAKCRDCYRCVRVCPVHAIKMKDGQAQVITERCITCGTCITVCPQQAKSYRTDYIKVLQMIEDGETLALSLAPSFVSNYNDWEQERLPSALRMLGFKYVGETAVGALHSALATSKYIKENSNKSHICSACPAIVSFILHEFPELTSNIVPIVSPMMAHARILKSRNSDVKVVFAGPCVAKKEEAQWGNNELFIDAVLTFEELDELFRLKNIHFEECENSSFDEHASPYARMFPLEGGLLRTAEMETNMLDKNVIAISGADEIKEALINITEMKSETIILEPLFCKNGCINGPFVKQQTNNFSKRRKILNYAGNCSGLLNQTIHLYEKMETQCYPIINTPKHTYTEEEIRNVLIKTGKHQISDELNCTSCGYNTCREKAIAVLDNIAEIDMCMPYMRQLAEQKIDTIITHDPNGIGLLSNKLEIIHMNTAFKKMFSCSDTMIGKKINYLIDPDLFEKLITGKDNVLRQAVQYSSYNLICHLIAYTLPEEKNIVGIFVDITDSKSNKDKLNEVKSETILKAQELIEHQISMAQELAKVLGDNTARGEILMKNLIDSIKK